MPALQNPYQCLPPSSFWRTGVAQRPATHFEQLWTPRFAMPRGTRFATAGSCFAQHISAWLRRHGHQWLDSEPAPEGCDEAGRIAGGYGVFSFRTGNIYNAELLKQWVHWALGITEPPDEVFEHEGAWFDPFRPQIPQHGLPSAAAVAEARAHTLHCIRRTLLQTDVLIFTLGLTEGWVHEAGHAYPACPGTLRGRFDERVHHFVNRGVESIVADLNQAFDVLRAVNPRMRFLLTVSPVPLTATASKSHVLVATTYSKSVLRAAAGALCERRADTDYFPSYELISSFASRGRYYDDNLRTVTADGVDFVMGHFGRAIDGDATAGAITTAPARRTARAAVPGGIDEVCEDILLETWNRAAPAAEARLCLVGDSHMGMLSRAFDRQGIAHCGGMIMSGSDWFANEFRLDRERLFEPLVDDDARARWAETLPFFNAAGRRGNAGNSVIMNLGLHTHVSVPSYLDWHLRKRGHLKLGIDDSRQFFLLINRDKLTIAERLLQQGYRVLLVTDPPTQHLHAESARMVPAFEGYERLACSMFAALGCETFLAREHFGGTAFDERYRSTTRLADGSVDWLHGSTAYYDALAQALLQRYALAD